MFKVMTIVTIFLGLSLKSISQEINRVQSIDQVNIWTKKSGNGPICIFVHGGPGMWSRSFEELGGNSLESNLTMIYYDQRGSGRSGSSINNQYDINSMVEEIESIRKKYTNEKVFLIGHSFGAILITHYAKKYQNHLNGLIVLNGTLNINESLKSQIDFVSEQLKESFPFDETNYMEVFGKARRKMSDQKLDYAFLTEIPRNAIILDSIDALKPAQYDFGNKVFQFPEYLQDHTLITEKIKVPVLIITGTKDYAIGPKHYKSFKFPNQMVSIIDGGHILYYEQNDLLKKTVFEFVKKVF